MAKVVTLGITTIGFADIASDGGPGTVFTSVESTLQDSAEMTQEDPTKNPFYEEESDLPFYVSITQGKISFTFKLAQPDVNQLALFFGGTVTAGPPATWELPDGYVTIEKTMKIEPRVGLKFLIPRAQITAKMGDKFSKSNPFTITITVEILKPNKVGVKAMKITNPA